MAKAIGVLGHYLHCFKGNGQGSDGDFMSNRENRLFFRDVFLDFTSH